MAKNNGCAYGRENRIMIKSIKEDITEIKESILTISNHYSKRLPLWATVIITILCTVIGVMGTMLARAMFG